MHEAARALEPVVEQEILESVRTVELLYADETAWKEHARVLWLWVFTCATATLFIVGRRTRAMVQHVLGEHFRNWLMSDGYGADRDHDQRLRCFAHLLRKAHGLEESLDAQAKQFGRQVLEVLETVIAAVYDARGDPPPRGCARDRPPCSTRCSRRAGRSPPMPRTRKPARSPASCSTTGIRSGSCSTIPSCR